MGTYQNIPAPTFMCMPGGEHRQLAIAVIMMRRRGAAHEDVPWLLPCDKARLRTMQRLRYRQKSAVRC